MADDTQSKTEAVIIPRHRWTHDADRVLILKCIDRDGVSRSDKHPDFVWPESGPVEPAKWSREATCESGGLFGWPWGFGLGDGKSPDYLGLWVVFAAHPDDVIPVEDGGKVKAVPNPKEGRMPEVIFRGDYVEANRRILDGQVAWILHAASGAASATGERGAASATGWMGAASATGERGAASATGGRGIAASTGEFGAVEGSATGIAVSTANECWWHVVEGALFLQRWEGGHRLVVAEEIGAKTGDRVRFVRGEVVEHVRAANDVEDERGRRPAEPA